MESRSVPHDGSPHVVVTLGQFFAIANIDDSHRFDLEKLD